MDLLTLCMMVKNEANTIKRTLDSVKDIIDRWVIVDTCSTDATKKVALESLSQIPGKLYTSPFVDFSTTRNELLKFAGHETKFLLLLDAEDVLTGGKELREFLEKNTAIDAANISITFENQLQYKNTKVLRSGSGWHYQGPVQEVLYGPNGETNQDLILVPNVGITHVRTEETHETSNRKRLYEVQALRAALRKNPHDVRSVFYLAEAHRNLGQYEAASAAYRYRITLGGWTQDIYCSVLYLGRVRKALGDPWAVVQHIFLGAQSVLSDRAEALYDIAEHYWETSEYQLCYMFSKLASEKKANPDALFLEKDVYEYKALDLLSRSAWYVGEYEVGREAVLEALKARPDLEHLQRTLKFYEERNKAATTYGRMIISSK